MTPSGLSVLLRFWAGPAGSVGIGMVAFGLAVFDPGRATVQCVTVGLLVAGVLTTIRVGSLPAALGLVMVFSVIRLGTAGSTGWGLAIHAAVSAFLLGLGVILIAKVYALLAQSRLRFGKFLLVGPMLSVLYIALAPMAHFHTMAFTDPTTTWMFDGFLGLLIGDGAGLGVELTELLTERAPDAGRQSDAKGEAA